MNTTKQEKTVKELFVGKCWAYLYDNFHKFSTPNQIRIALALAQKDMPTEINGMDMKQIVMMGEIKRGEAPLRFNIGEKIDVGKP